MVENKFKLIFEAFFEYYKEVFKLDYKADRYVYENLDEYNDDYENFGRILNNIYGIIYKNVFFMSNPFADENVTSYGIELNENQIGFLGIKLGLYEKNYSFSTQSYLKQVKLYLDEDILKILKSQEGAKIIEDIGLNDLVFANKKLNDKIETLYKQADENETKLFDQFFESIMSGDNNLIYTSVASPLLREIRRGNWFSMIDREVMENYLDEFHKIINELNNCHELSDLIDFKLVSAIGWTDSNRGLFIPPHNIFDRRFVDDYDGDKDYKNDEDTNKNLQPFSMFVKMKGMIYGE